MSFLGNSYSLYIIEMQKTNIKGRSKGEKVDECKGNDKESEESNC